MADSQKKKKAPLPTKQQILDFVRESPTPAGKREIARAFQITGADRSRDGSAVAVRTYTQLYVFRADPATGRVLTAVPPTICSVAAP